ncbi:MAG TPA: deoxyribose-phosphate aldolase [Coxiellaceae bacterium]|nr:deoxyribose-phosphate aldolase [Coxiellaceae bacterium]
MDELERTRLISYLDFTRLNEPDSLEAVHDWCLQAKTPKGFVAAVCVYPDYVYTAKLALQHTPIKIATVVNFPEGNQSIHAVSAVIQESIEKGADEIDVVMPPMAALARDFQTLTVFLSQCREACGSLITLKVILETGVLKTAELIRACCECAIETGADFIKTSTGKTQTGATLEAARTILETIRDQKTRTGFKVSGGVSDVSQAIEYFHLAQALMGSAWPTPDTFRIGSSQLLAKLLSA